MTIHTWCGRHYVAILSPEPGSCKQCALFMGGSCARVGLAVVGDPELKRFPSCLPSGTWPGSDARKRSSSEFPGAYIHWALVPVEQLEDVS